MLSTKNAGALIDGASKDTEGETMVKIKLTRNTVVNGKAQPAGKTIPATKEEARFLIQIGKALPVADDGPQVENREKDLEANARKSGRGKK